MQTRSPPFSISIKHTIEIPVANKIRLHASGYNITNFNYKQVSLFKCNFKEHLAISTSSQHNREVLIINIIYPSHLNLNKIHPSESMYNIEIPNMNKVHPSHLKIKQDLPISHCITYIVNALEIIAECYKIQTDEC